jgi:UDP-galactopyranose mutase
MSWRQVPRMTADLICFSHLRWDFVFQRPNHLMSRFAKDRRVFYVEEPLYHPYNAQLDVQRTAHGPMRVLPKLPERVRNDPQPHLARLIDQLLRAWEIESYELWYYTPMALPYTRHLTPQLVVYDVMDELKSFRFAPPELLNLERELFARADVVFTGGESLYQAKRHMHPDVHAFPSSVDVGHFSRARQQTTDPEDQEQLPHPRLGYFGVIDERMNLELVAQLCDLEPEWQVVMVGPTAKIDPATLPQRQNLHWLGPKTYAELPDYISGWDIAFMPFALNASTEMISPTKTPEFLAAGRPVISTPITDVVNPYGELRLVKIASDAQGFVAAAKQLLQEDPAQRLHRADAFLKVMSWDMTWHRMNNAMAEARARRERRHAAPSAA